MKITDIRIEKLSTPLKKPFKTALRTLQTMEHILVVVKTDKGIDGYGGAAPTAVITGDTTASIMGAIDCIKSSIIGRDIRQVEDIFIRINHCMVGNTSAKAAVDMAVYDLYGKLYGAPLYQLLGGYRTHLLTDLTISLNAPHVMVSHSLDAVSKGYTTLKIKVGEDAQKDINRLLAIRKAVGEDVVLRIDANQGWKPKEAVYVIQRMEQGDIHITCAEQPVNGKDFEGMKYVKERVNIPIIADESVFSPADALRLIQMQAVDMMNIKLMKTGGIYNALTIMALAEAAGIQCMIGSMMESKIGIAAAAHLGASKAVIVDVDLDVPILCEEDSIMGGVIYDGSKISFTNKPGLGLEQIAIE
ncbi:dipeptide epimerase [Vallitalea pronyensis]|uniref:Dipeptide epimerase n=1 Tax=Vallitalea pronyensis TaxID=1348613 RepID=A0A8J8MK55_9FIRM|nr:dipeptide epimerase [Vallitalea pronyensis]QUI23029.1 dipeptide epimerase [Vallitalea pronyensis]